ncbi:MAG TPA: hypothetical protein VKV17_06345 [Bryobacteraceae bacterium]|nr:hypothetical protein [Bryobacteraceae bacterium]
MDELLCLSAPGTWRRLRRKRAGSWPAAVVRCGEAEGLPVAVQVVAHPFREDIALAIAQRLEEAFGGWKPPSIS